MDRKLKVDEDERSRDLFDEYVIKSSVALERIAEYMQNSSQWPELIKTMNQELATHNTKTELLCQNIATMTEENKSFRTEVWTTLKWVVFVSVGALVVLAGGIEIFKILG